MPSVRLLRYATGNVTSIYHPCCTCIDFYNLSAWGGCWFAVYIRRFTYKFLNVSFWLHGWCGEWEGWARKPVNHTSWVALVTPTDRPKSVRNRCVIELFCGIVCVVTWPFWHFCWCRGFCHRTESDLFPFLSVHIVLASNTKGYSTLMSSQTLWVICSIISHGEILMLPVAPKSEKDRGGSDFFLDHWPQKAKILLWCKTNVSNGMTSSVDIQTWI